MKKNYLGFLVFFGIFVITSCSSNNADTKNQNDVVMQQQNSGTQQNNSSAQRRSAKAGGEVIFKLDSNPTTGYAWHITNLDTLQKVELINNEYTPAEVKDGVVGSGGVQSFVFKVKEGVEGSEEVYFSYLRPWETEAPAANEAILEIIIDK